MPFIRRRNKENLEVDEVFLDSENSLGFSKENLEGSLERPIKRNVFVYASAIFIIISVSFLFRVGSLQISRGEEFYLRSQNNHLRFVEVVPERGGIYDRSGERLASNEFFGFLLSESGPLEGEKEKLKEWVRRYPTKGFLHVLGFLRNTTGNLLQGVSGLEAYYDDLLKGDIGKRIEEVSAIGNVVDSGLYLAQEPGSGLLTTLSRGLQTKLTELIESTAETYGFSGGAGVMMDARNGEIFALVSVPDFDPNIFFNGAPDAEIKNLLENSSKPFFNRAISGLYPPGSIVKMAVAAGALSEGIIDPKKQIFSSGALTLPNPYDASRPSVFKDWKPHGWVDMERAIAVSSDVYFYSIGGGFEEQQGLGVQNINKYFSLFGFGKSTGLDLFGEQSGSLPDPLDEQRTRPWTVGDTYNISIGQGEVLVTPLQMAVYAAAVASKGILPVPHIGKAELNANNEIVSVLAQSKAGKRMLTEEIFGILHRGMRLAVTEGTASALFGLPIKVAAKTGTAEIGKTGRVHSWSVGFFPYEDPVIAYVILMEDGSETNLVGATYVAREIINWIALENLLEKLDN